MGKDDSFKEGKYLLPLVTSIASQQLHYLLSLRTG